jgi:hypothetical protein
LCSFLKNVLGTKSFNKNITNNFQGRPDSSPMSYRRVTPRDGGEGLKHIGPW